METLSIFTKEEFGKIRTVKIENKIYFVAIDIAKILGYSDPTNAIKLHCRWVVKHHIPHPQSEVKTLEVNVITESDLYRLIANSKLPKAQEFESWVFDEVIPLIRKHGAYMTENTIEQLMNDPDFGIRLLSTLKEEREKNKQLQLEKEAQNTQIAIKNQQIAELKPRADYTDIILRSKATVGISAIAKDYGMSGKALNKILNVLKVQFLQGGQWLLYAKYQKEGYTHSDTITFQHSDGREDSRMHTKWRQKGRLFLYNILKENGYLPVIEQDTNKNILNMFH